MAEHRPLGLAGGAGGVEKPGRISRVAIGHDAGVAYLHEGVGPGRGVDDFLERGRLLGRLGDGGDEVGRHEAEPGAGILQDEGEFLGVQLGIHRHGTEAGMPDRVHHLDRLDAIGHGEGHAIAGGQAEAHAQMRAHHRHLAP